MSGDGTRACASIADENALVARILAARVDGGGADAGEGDEGVGEGRGGEEGEERAGTVPRLLVALAGPPGAGKSTLAARLVGKLPDAVVMPMDGFHVDDALLGPAGLLPSKGSPSTFDVTGLAATLERVRRDDADVLVPLFDRERELSRAAAVRIGPRHRIVVVEGNYLLLDENPWDVLDALFDVRVRIDVDEDVLRERLVGRWLGFGFERAEALARAEANDLPNGALVRERSRVPDVLYAPPLDGEPS